MEKHFYHLNVLVILMALNECAVHAYVIIIEKKKVVIHLNRFYYCLMCFAALTGASYDFFNCLNLHDLYLETRKFRMIFVVFWPNNYNSLNVLPALIIIIANWKNTKRDFDSFLLESFHFGWELNGWVSGVGLDRWALRSSCSVRLFVVFCQYFVK